MNRVTIVYNRLLNSFRQSSISTAGRNISVLASIGVAVQGDGQTEFDTWQELIRAADAALYSAKSLGRDRCCVFGSTDTATNGPTID